MNAISRTPSRILAIAAAALTMAFTTAYAAGNDMPGDPAQSASAPGWHGHGHRGGMMKDLNALHDELKLTPDQDKLWQTALDTMKRNHEAERANHQKMHQQFETMRQQPIIDLDALSNAHQQARQQDQQLRDSTRSAWLAVYDSLNNQQKATVSAKLKEHFAMMEKHREQMRQHWQQHHHGAASDAMPDSQ